MIWYRLAEPNRLSLWRLRRHVKSRFDTPMFLEIIIMRTSDSHLFNCKMLSAALERVDLAQIKNLLQKQQILAKWKQTNLSC